MDSVNSIKMNSDYYNSIGYYCYYFMKIKKAKTCFNVLDAIMYHNFMDL
jgi:hypothetical protein